MVYPSLIAAVSDASHPSWRARSLSVYRFWRDLGYAIGALMAGALADLFGIPVEWRFSLRVALAHREAQGNPELSASDHALLSWVRQEGFEQAGIRAETDEQQSARDFVRQVIHALTGHGDAHALPREQVPRIASR